MSHEGNDFLKEKSKDESNMNQLVFYDVHKEMLLKYFKEYKKLGGSHSLDKYEKNIESFMKITLDSFVFGDLTKHSSEIKEGESKYWSSCHESFNYWKAQENISQSEGCKYFKSVDNITTYT